MFIHVVLYFLLTQAGFLMEFTQVIASLHFFRLEFVFKEWAMFKGWFMFKKLVRLETTVVVMFIFVELRVK